MNAGALTTMEQRNSELLYPQKAGLCIILRLSIMDVVAVQSMQTGPRKARAGDRQISLRSD